jgi:hypothetical protein
MNRLIRELDIVDIQVVTFSSEIDYLPDNLVKYISNRSSIIYVCFDYDIHGIAAANKLQKGYGYIPMYFGDSYSIKDISDYCKQSGYTNTLKLFKSKFDNVISKNSTIKYTTSNG